MWPSARRPKGARPIGKSKQEELNDRDLLPLGPSAQKVSSFWVRG